MYATNVIGCKHISAESLRRRVSDLDFSMIVMVVPLILTTMPLVVLFIKRKYNSYVMACCTSPIRTSTSTKRQLCHLICKICYCISCAEFGATHTWNNFKSKVSLFHIFTLFKDKKWFLLSYLPGPHGFPLSSSYHTFNSMAPLFICTPLKRYEIHVIGNTI